ncbi:HNH endonuclease [Streptomyces sp. ISL-96]|nr:HNH endonuclease [Streptomyces sp. ISL-96]
MFPTPVVYRCARSRSRAHELIKHGSTPAIPGARRPGSSGGREIVVSAHVHPATSRPLAPGRNALIRKPGIALPVAELAAVLAVTGCEAIGGGGSPSGPGPAASDGRAAGPLDNPDGTRPGLAPVTADGDRAEARELLGKLSTKGRGPRTGYARREFGYAWMDTAEGVPLARNGCDTRNDLLARDGRDLRYRDGSDCVVVAMTLHDPYTSKTIEWRKRQATEVQIDHVVPLSYSWQMGASRWPESKREQLANDVMLAV